MTRNEVDGKCDAFMWFSGMGWYNLCTGGTFPTGVINGGDCYERGSWKKKKHTHEAIVAGIPSFFHQRKTNFTSLERPAVQAGRKVPPGGHNPLATGPPGPSVCCTSLAQRARSVILRSRPRGTRGTFPLRGPGGGHSPLLQITDEAEAGSC